MCRLYSAPCAGHGSCGVDMLRFLAGWHEMHVNLVSSSALLVSLGVCKHCRGCELSFSRLRSVHESYRALPDMSCVGSVSAAGADSDASCRCHWKCILRRSGTSGDCRRTDAWTGCSDSSRGSQVCLQHHDTVGGRLRRHFDSVSDRWAAERSSHCHWHTRKTSRCNRETCCEFIGLFCSQSLQNTL